MAYSRSALASAPLIRQASTRTTLTGFAPRGGAVARTSQPEPMTIGQAVQFAWDLDQRISSIDTAKGASLGAAWASLVQDWRAWYGPPLSPSLDPSVIMGAGLQSPFRTLVLSAMPGFPGAPDALAAISLNLRDFSARADDAEGPGLIDSIGSAIGGGMAAGLEGAQQLDRAKKVALVVAVVAVGGGAVWYLTRKKRRL